MATNNMNESEQALQHLWDQFCRGALMISDVENARKILEIGCPEELLPKLATMIWYGNLRWREELGGVFLALARRIPVGIWPRLDESIRFQLSYYSQDQCHSLRVDYTKPELMLIGLCHPQGKLREQAILHSESLELLLRAILLLLRINDWVGSIQQLAAAALQPILSKLDTESRVKLLPLIERLRHCGRHHYRAQVGAWRNTLADPWDEKAWLEAWKNAKGKEKRLYLDVLKKSPQAFSPAARRQLFESNDRLALFWCLREILPALSQDERLEAYASFASSKAVPVRREWLLHLVETGDAAATERLREHLVHSSRSLRQFARFYLARLAPMDFVDFYLNALRDERTEAAALLGLREVSAKHAHHESLARIDSPKPAVRRAALEALDSDSIGSHLDHLIKEAGSNMPGVPKAARLRLFEAARLFGIHLLVNPECLSHMDMMLKAYVIQRAYRFQKWDSLEILLLVRDVNRHLVEEGLLVWEQRMNMSFVMLSEVKRERLMELLPTANLFPASKTRIQFILEREK